MGGGCPASCRRVAVTGTVVRDDTRRRTMKHENFNIPADMLPREVATMASLVGMEAAMAIAKTYGGRRLYIPRKARSNHQLVTLIGTEKLEALCHHYDGERLTIPSCDRALKYVRNREIRAAYGPVSLSKLAARYNLSESQVLRIVA